MAVAAWAASTAYSVGNIRRASSSQVTGLFFRCVTAGTSAGSEPVWPTDIGIEATDNTVVWKSISSVYADISVLAPSAIIELFELRLNNNLHGSTNITRWHNGCNAALTGGIVWGAETYSALAIKAEGFELTSSGSLPRPTLTVSNLDGLVTALLIDVNKTTSNNDLTGAEVRRIRTLKKFLDGENDADPNAQWPVEIWYIDRKATENREIVQFELASKFDLAGQFIPKRQLIANVCQWEYRSSECSYTGSNYWDVDDNSVTTLGSDRCGKRLSSCKLRFGNNGELPFGSFPSVGKVR
jgi:lambda family phage minor tail protein L